MGELQAATVRWRDRLLVAALTLIGTICLTYPSAAQWFTSVELADQAERISQNAPVEPARSAMLDAAHDYNTHLAGADPAPGAYERYESLLDTGEHTAMGRLTIPKNNTDLPIFHGTSAHVLNQGVGHLYGSHLPVGGDSTRTVLTAHTGLAERELFTHLNQLAPGDTFDIEVAGTSIRYQVTTIETVTPEQADVLKPETGRDLASLVTCTPIGLNTHRLVVTGERIPLDTPPHPDKHIEVPGFPWWAVWGGGGVAAAVTYLAWPLARSRFLQRHA